MPSIPRRAAWLLMTATAVHALTIPASALALGLDSSLDNSLYLLWERASSCSSGFTPCAGGSVPDNFCCSAGSTCNVLAANTTVVCCPPGSSCATLAPISCDISLQDVSLHPDATFKTTALNGALPKCASGCCPFGYSCNSGSCVVNANQNASPIQTAPAKTSTAAAAATTTTKPSSTPKSSSAPKSTTSTADGVTAAVPTRTSTSTPTASATSTFFSSLTSTMAPTATATATDAATTTDASSGNAGNASANESAVASADNHSGGNGSSSSTPSVVGGVIGGIAGLFLIGAAAWFLLTRVLRRKDAAARAGEKAPGSRAGSSSSTSASASFGHILNNPLAISISSPRPQGNTTAFRTDFIRKPMGSSLGSDSRPGSAGALLAKATSKATSKAPKAAGFYKTPNANLGSTGNPYDNYGSTYDTAGGTSLAPSLNTTISTSPFSVSMPSPPSPPSPTPPLTLLRQQQQQPAAAVAASKRDSVPPIRGMRPQARQPSTEEINVGADPSLIRAGGGNFAMSPEGTDTTSPGTIRAIANAALAASNGNLGAPPQDPRRLTTFSSLMAAANLDQNRPFVPSVTSSPARR